MKKVIDGKVYNTATATKIAEWWNGYGCSDFKYCEEGLYRTKKGQYFIAGEGGPMSNYATPCGGGAVGGGRGISLVDESEALDWCEERNIDADIVAEHFEIEEG